MIITRSPLRITLGGGGTDLPSYYRNYEGFLISAAIDKYVFVTVMRPFTAGIFLKYSSLEKVEKVDEVQHPILREAIICTASQIGSASARRAFVTTKFPCRPIRASARRISG